MVFENKIWFNKLNFTQQSLIKQSFYLLDWVKKHKEKFYDYSFIVMPAAKAYEGFLKQLFFDLKLISQRQLEGDFFRVGKALNPELEHIKRLRRQYLYDEISQKCGEKTAELLWQTWKKCRNRLFHYFAKEQQIFTLEESEERLEQIVKAIEIAFKKCGIRGLSHSLILDKE